MGLSNTTNTNNGKRRQTKPNGNHITVKESYLGGNKTRTRKNNANSNPQHHTEITLAREYQQRAPVNKKYSR